MNREFFIKFMSKRIDNICLSIRHDYGIMTPHEKSELRHRVVEYLMAVSKEIPEESKEEIPGIVLEGVMH